MAAPQPPTQGPTEPDDAGQPPTEPAPRRAEPAGLPTERTGLDRDSGHPRLEESRAWNAMSYLITGPVVFGLAGWGLDSWLGTSWLVPVGILAGMAVSLYLVWFRYGTH